MYDYSHRQQKTTLRLVDKEGNALASRTVRAKLKNHEFFFGSGAFDTLSMDQPFYKERVDKWTAMFNYGTLPFYWGGFEPVEGAPETESRMKAAKYLVSQGAAVKGHPLCWHTSCADWLLKYDNKTILDKQLERIHRDVTEFKGVIDIWDVINETVIMPVFDRYDNAITRICNAYGRNTLIKEVFDAAHAANPDALLLINDFDLSEDYARVIDECLNAGVPIGAIGLQSHQHQGYKGMEWMNTVLNRFSPFGLPLHFTENTLISGELMPKYIVDLNDWQVDEWPTTPEYEARQEREWKEMYERLFADKAVEAITGWDFADGAWLHAPSGIIREDNSEKPVYHTLKRLVHEEWTTDVTLTTNASGEAVFTGYRGQYELCADGQCADFCLGKGDEKITVTL